MEIPEMTDPLSKYWNQPSRHDILIDEKHALMSGKTFDQLAEYSLTVPSGQYDGKMWKMVVGNASALRWFHGDFIHSRVILILQ